MSPQSPSKQKKKEKGDFDEFKDILQNITYFALSVVCGFLSSNFIYRKSITSGSGSIIAGVTGLVTLGLFTIKNIFAKAGLGTILGAIGLYGGYR